MNGLFVTFDFGARFGYCQGVKSTPPVVGSWDFDGVDRVARTLDLCKKLCGLIGQNGKVTAVGYAIRPQRAGQRFTGTAQAHDWGGYRALVELAAGLGDCPVIPFHEATARKLVLGKGSATKTEALLAMRERFPKVRFPGFDEADAAVAWLYLCETFGKDG